MTDFTLKKDTDLSFDEALAKVPEALKQEGFGVLTEIDVKGTLKKKIDADFRNYRILGACNPKMAFRALSHTLDVGVMLPCNIVVYEGDGGKATVLAIDPMQTMAAHGDAELQEVAALVRKALSKALENI